MREAMNPSWEAIKCPYCGSVSGKYDNVFNGMRSPIDVYGTLLVNVLKCHTCGNFTFVLWMRTAGRGIDHLVAPAPKPKPEDIVGPDAWPHSVGDAWAQAQRGLLTRSWDSAATMARRSVQAALREKGIKGRDLVKEITNMVTEGLITKQLADWAHQVRSIGNVGAHPDEDDVPVSEEDARDVVDFAYYFAHHLYTLPAQIEELRERRKKPA